MSERLARCFAIAAAVVRPWPPSRVRRFHRQLDAIQLRLMRGAARRLRRGAP